MIKRQTWLNVADSTTVVWLQTFHLYKGFKRLTTFQGQFIKGSAKIVTPPRLEYKGFKLKFNVKGDVCRSLITRVNKKSGRLDGGTTTFYYNTCILIKKKQNVKSKYVLGPVEKLLRRKKFKSIFKLLV